METIIALSVDDFRAESWLECVDEYDILVVGREQIDLLAEVLAVAAHRRIARRDHVIFQNPDPHRLDAFFERTLGFRSQLANKLRHFVVVVETCDGLDHRLSLHIVKL